MMRINLFEGGRRIVYIAMACSVFGGVALSFFQAQSTSVAYEIRTVGVEPVRSNTACATGDASDVLVKTTPGGSDVNIQLCFRSFRAANGVRFIPTHTDNGRVLGSQPSSVEATKYISDVRDRFQLPAGDAFQLDQELRKARLMDTALGLIMGLLGAGALWGAASIFGWILRGFLGIEQGQDSRRPSKRVYPLG